MTNAAGGSHQQIQWEYVSCHWQTNEETAPATHVGAPASPISKVLVRGRYSWLPPCRLVFLPALPGWS